jgi:hypothetical protein
VDDIGCSGLYLTGHRFYDPSLGRFLSRDPIGHAGDLNLFRYSRGNPSTLTDHTGLDPATGRGTPLPTIQVQFEPQMFPDGGMDFNVQLIPMNSAVSEGRLFIDVSGIPNSHIQRRVGPGVPVFSPLAGTPLTLFDLDPRNMNRNTPCPPHGRAFNIGTSRQSQESLRFSLLSKQLFDSSGNPRYSSLEVAIGIIGASAIPGTKTTGPIQMFEYDINSGTRSKTMKWQITFGDTSLQHGNF